MKEKLAKNDAFVAYLSNPKATVLDYIQNGINSSNTQLLEKENYKLSPLILKTFTDDKGVFDEAKFDEHYNKASEKYFELADQAAFENFLQWSPNSRYRPVNSDMYDTSVKVFKNRGQRLAASIEGLNVISDPEKTEEELAQMGKVWDSDNKKWKEGTAESQSLVSKVLGQTLVYAQYDRDGEQLNPVTGKLEYHRKGEWMLDEDGNYFTMTLGKEDLGTKKVVALGDILTKENSFVNKLDFWDSDGFDKSVGGIAMKTAISILPYLIPGFNSYYGAITAGIGLISVMPTFYKALDSLVTGDSDTIGKNPATQMENWFRKFKPSKSRAGLESFFSIESVGELLADTFGQLHQQRAAAGLAKYFKLMPEAANIKSVGDFYKAAKKMNRTQQSLALGYMGLISTADIYNDALNAGYDTRTAGITALASAAALFGIMNFNETARGIGTWFLNKTTGFTKEVEKGSIKSIAKIFYKDAEEAISAAKFGDYTKLNNFFGNYWASAKDKMQDIFVIGGEGVWKNSIVEGVEEVTEEAVQDTVKGIVDVLSYLGYAPKQGSFGGWDNVFSKEGASRYLLTFLGGALGGAVFDLLQNTIDPLIRRTFIDPNYKSETQKRRERDIIDVVFDGRTDELIESLKGLHSIFNTKKGYTGYTDKDGNQYDIKSDNQKSQADMIIDFAIQEVKAIDSFVKGQLGIKDFKSLNLYVRDSYKQNYADEYRNADLLNYQINKLKKELTSMYDAYTAWLGLLNDSENKENNKDRIEAYEKEFNQKRNNVKNMFSGESTQRTLLEMQVIGVTPFKDRLKYDDLTKLDFDSWYNMVYKNINSNIGDFTSLPVGSDLDLPNAITLKSVERQYQIYHDSLSKEIVDKAPILADTYLALQKVISPDVKKFVVHANKLQYLKGFGSFKWDDDIQEYFDSLPESEEIYEDPLSLYGAMSALGKTNPRAFSLSERINFDLASILESKGVIDLSDFTEEEKKVIKNYINITAATSGMNIFNADTINALLVKVNRGLSDSSNIYRKRLVELQVSNEEGDENENAVINTSEEAESKINDKNINWDLSKVDEDIINSKFKGVQDLIGKDDYISPELEAILINYAAAAVTKRFEDLKNGIDSNDIERIEWTKISNNVFFNTLKKSLKNYNFFTSNYNSNAIIDDLISELFEQEIIEPSQLSLDIKKDLINTLGSIKEKFGNKQSLEKNPLLAAFEKIHFALNKTSNGKNIYDYLFSKESDIQNSDFTGDTISFTETERQDLRQALQTLQVFNVAIQGMLTGTESTLVKPQGINKIQIDFLEAYQNKKGVEDYLILDELDFSALGDFLGNLYDKIRTLLEIDSELTKSKSEVYDHLRKLKQTAHKLFYSSNFLKTFKIDLPDDDKKEVNLLEGFDPNKAYKSDEEFNIAAEEAICKNLRALCDGFSEDPTLGISKEELFLQKLLNGIKHISVSGSGFMSDEDLLRDGIQSWNAIRGNEKGFEFINGTYLLQKFFKLLYISPKDEYDLLKKIYKANPSISPRVDQEEALANMEFFISFTNEASLLEKVLNDTEKTVNSKNLVNKQLLTNIGILMGSGGSGKSLLIELMSRHKDKSKIFVSAMNELKVEELKALTNKEGDVVYKMFKGLGEAEESFFTAIEEITKCLYDNRSNIKDNKNYPKGLVLKSVNNKVYTFSYDNDKGLKFDFDYDDSSDLISIDKFYFNSFPTITTNIEEGNILFIDECTQLSPFAQFVISKIATEKKFKVIEVGDPIQPGWMSPAYNAKNTNEKVVKGYIAYDLSEYRGFMLGNLYGMWRADVVPILDAISSLYKIYSTPQGNGNTQLFDYSKTGQIDQEAYDKDLLPSIKNVPFTFSIENDDKPVKGIVLNRDDRVNEAINAITSGKRIVIIPDSADEDAISKELKEKYPDMNLQSWLIRKSSDVQGSEVDYALVYGFDGSNLSWINKNKLAFMLLTRGKNATIVANSPLFGELSLRMPESKQLTKANTYAEETRDRIALARVQEIENLLEKCNDIKVEEKQPLPPTFSGIPPEYTKELEIQEDLNAGDAESEDDSGKNLNNITKERSDKWKSVGLSNALQIGGWYTRLGVTINESTSIDNLVNDTSSNGYSDLPGFAKIIKVLKENSNSFSEIKNILSNLNIDYKNINSVESLISAFKTFKNYLYDNIDTGQFYTFIWCGPTDASKDYPFEKLNQAENNPIPTMRGGVFFEDENTSPRTKYRFTCGAFNQNTYEENGEIKIVSKTLNDLYQEGKNSGIYRYFEKQSTVDKDVLDTHEKGFELLHSNDRLTKQVDFTKPIVRNSGPIQLKLENSDSNKKVLGEENLKYGRVSLHAYLNLGYEIVRSDAYNTKDGFLKLPGNTASERKNNFKKWIEQFRFIEFKPEDRDSQERLLSTFDRQWILLKKAGTGELIPIMVSKTVQSIGYVLNNDPLSWGKDSKIFSEYRLRSLIRCLLQNKANLELLKRFDELKLSYDVEKNSFDKDEIYKQIIADIQTLFKNDAYSKDINILLDSWYNTKKRSVFWSALYAKYPNDDQQKTRSDKATLNNRGNVLFDEGKIIKKDNWENKIGELIKYIDSNYPDYFYDSTSNTSFNPRDLKIERIYEPSKKLWDFDMMVEFGKIQILQQEFDEKKAIEDFENKIRDRFNSKTGASDVVDEIITKLISNSDSLQLLGERIGQLLMQKDSIVEKFDKEHQVLIINFISYNSTALRDVAQSFVDSLNLSNSDAANNFAEAFNNNIEPLFISEITTC